MTITIPFANVQGLAGANSLSVDTDYNIIYHDATGTFVDQSNVATSFAGGASFTQIKIQFLNTSVTPVRIDSFTSKNEGGGVLLSWHSLSQISERRFRHLSTRSPEATTGRRSIRRSSAAG